MAKKGNRTALKIHHTHGVPLKTAWKMVKGGHPMPKATRKTK